VVMTIGVPGKASAFMSGEPFCRCTHTALAPNGDIFVADGYGNACIHHYTKDGKLVKSWGVAGSDYGCFNIVHNIVSDTEGILYVADRENHRIQLFDTNGKFKGQWNNVHRPCGLYTPRTPDGYIYVAELSSYLDVNRAWPNLGPRITILDRKGKVIARIGKKAVGFGPDQFISPHGISVDRHGDIYLGEVANNSWPRAFTINKADVEKDLGHRIMTFRKLILEPEK